jgi:Ca2+-binding RTX toxin-like protein
MSTVQRVAVLVVLAAAVVAPATASAASTASVVNGVIQVVGDDTAQSIVFTDGSPSFGYGSYITDDRGPVTAGDSCVSDGSGGAKCGTAATTELDILLAGGDDSVAVRGTGFCCDYLKKLKIDGGAGDDSVGLAGSQKYAPTVVLGDGNDTFLGSDGTDTVDGEAGNDSIKGNGGDDTLYGGADTDTLDGQSGSDRVRGGDGDDVVQGGAGDDDVFGDAGKDKLNGDGDTPETGNDTIEAVDGEADQVTCDFGADVANVDSIDTVEGAGMCETVNVDKSADTGGATVSLAKLASGQKVLKTHAINARVRCSAACFMGAFAKIRIGSGKAFVAYSDIRRVTAAGSRTIRIVLSSKQRTRIASALGAGKKVRATVYGALTDDTGEITAVSAGRTMTIRR